MCAAFTLVTLTPVGPSGLEVMVGSVGKLIAAPSAMFLKTEVQTPCPFAAQTHLIGAGEFQGKAVRRLGGQKDLVGDGGPIVVVSGVAAWLTGPPLLLPCRGRVLLPDTE